MNYPLVIALNQVAAALPEKPELQAQLASTISTVKEMHEDLYQTRVRAENWCNELQFARDSLAKAKVDCTGKHGTFIHYGIERLIASAPSKEPVSNIPSDAELIAKMHVLLDQFTTSGLFDKLTAFHHPDVINNFCDLINEVKANTR